MGCLLILFAIILPRITMILLFLFTNWFAVFPNFIWPLLGFFFMPYTTLAYMAGMVYNHQISNGWIVLLIIAIIFDLGSHRGSYSRIRY